MTVIKGADISYANGQPNFDTLKSSLNFVLSKATEGNVYYDTQFIRNQSEARRVGLLTGYYHFARPDLGNTPEAEAQAFINRVWPLRNGELVLLDYEVNYNDPVTWCKRWLDYIKTHLDGLKPLIYFNKSTMNNYNWQPVVDAGYGLWLADYDNKSDVENAAIKYWPFVAIKQYWNQGQVSGINGLVDMDSFFGDLSAFGKYGYQAPTPPAPAPDTKYHLFYQGKELHTYDSDPQTQVNFLTLQVGALNQKISNAQNALK